MKCKTRRPSPIGEVIHEVFVVDWHDKTNFNFVTLVLDLPNRLVHSSALLHYGTQNEVTSFDTAAVTGILH